MKLKFLFLLILMVAFPLNLLAQDSEQEFTGGYWTYVHQYHGPVAVDLYNGTRIGQFVNSPSEVIAVIPACAQVYVDAWFRGPTTSMSHVIYGDLEGWVESGNFNQLPCPSPLTFVEPTEEEQTLERPMMIQAGNLSGAKVRYGPGTDYARVTSLETGTWVTAIGQTNAYPSERWVAVNLEDNTQGWIANWLLTEVEYADCGWIPVMPETYSYNGDWYSLERTGCRTALGTFGASTLELRLHGDTGWYDTPFGYNSGQ